MKIEQLEQMAKITEKNYNDGLEYLKVLRKELIAISRFRQSKAVRTKRKELLTRIELTQERLRSTYENLQSIKNQLEPPTEE